MTLYVFAADTHGPTPAGERRPQLMQLAQRGRHVSLRAAGQDAAGATATFRADTAAPLDSGTRPSLG